MGVDYLMVCSKHKVRMEPYMGRLSELDRPENQERAMKFLKRHVCCPVALIGDDTTDLPEDDYQREYDLVTVQK